MSADCRWRIWSPDIESSLNKLSQVANKGWSSRLRGLVALVIPHCKNVACYEILCRILMDALKVRMRVE
jgi:hypothetical protein